MCFPRKCGSKTPPLCPAAATSASCLLTCWCFIKASPPFPAVLAGIHHSPPSQPFLLMPFIPRAATNSHPKAHRDTWQQTPGQAVQALLSCFWGWLRPSCKRFLTLPHHCHLGGDCPPLASLPHKPCNATRWPLQPLALPATFCISPVAKLSACFLLHPP